jgi:hypothetical protein
MAIAVTSGVSTTSTSNTNSYASASFTPAANDLLVVFIVADGTTTAAATMTDSQGLGFVKISDVAFNAGADHVYCFIAQKLAANSAMTVTFDCTGDNATGANIYVARVSGGEGIYWRQVSSGSGAAGATPAVAMADAFITSNGGIACVGNGANPAALTPPASWTETNGVDTGHATPPTGQECPNRTSGETGSTITWGGTSGTAWGAIVIELYVAGNGIIAPDPFGMNGFFGGSSSV